MLTNAPACREATFMAVSEMLLFVSFVYRYTTNPFLSTAAYRILSALISLLNSLRCLLKSLAGFILILKNDRFVYNVYIYFDNRDRKRVSQYIWPGD